MQLIFTIPMQVMSASAPQHQLTSWMYELCKALPPAHNLPFALMPKIMWLQRVPSSVFSDKASAVMLPAPAASASVWREILFIPVPEISITYALCRELLFYQVPALLQMGMRITALLPLQVPVQLQT